VFDEHLLIADLINGLDIAGRACRPSGLRWRCRDSLADALAPGHRRVIEHAVRRAPHRHLRDGTSQGATAPREKVLRTRPRPDVQTAPVTPRRAVVHEWLAPTAAASGLIVIFISALSLPLASSESLALTDRELVGWIMALYAVPGVLTLILAARYRQPILYTGNIFLLVFVASLGAEVPWSELVGAAVLAGLVVLAIGPLGVTGWLARWIPAPIVYGVLAGAILHFFVDLFTATGAEPFMVGATLLVYIAARRFVEPRIPALLPAIATGVILAIATGQTASIPTDVALLPAFVAPTLSINAVLTVTPVMVVLITLQANIPSAVFLRAESFEPPEALLNILSGAGSAASSLLGPVGVSLSLPATALCAGPDAGAPEHRHRSAYIAGVALVLIGAAAGLAAALAEALPRSLLVAFVGLAVIGVLLAALQNVTKGPLLLGPLFAFGISQSDVELLDLGPFFWALAGGILVSFTLEREALHDVRPAT
jgi:benzoate membrane transport protein